MSTIYSIILILIMVITIVVIIKGIKASNKIRDFKLTKLHK